jgi:hypothetical protein
VLTALFVVLFAVSAFVYWRRAKIAPDNPVQRRFIRRLSQSGMWIAGLGIFFAIMRYIGFLYLDDPFWLLLVFIAAILVIAYFVYDRSEHYPVAMWQLQQSALQRKYRPVPKMRTEPHQPLPKVRGKRRRGALAYS